MANIYEELRSMARDETPLTLGMFNGPHRMPGESGMSWDPVMKHTRDEREAREREAVDEHNKARNTCDGWERAQEDVKARVEARTDGA